MANHHYISTITCRNTTNTKLQPHCQTRLPYFNNNMQKYHQYKPATKCQTVTTLSLYTSAITCRDTTITKLQPNVKPDHDTSTITCSHTTTTKLQPNVKPSHYFNNSMQEYHYYKTSTQCQTITIFQQ
jgi:hypothetical protein